ncbi:MAG: hypothetical protein DRJ52_10955, partial [Thermoprotei archaeon]
GAPGSGKTTIALFLAEKANLLYQRLQVIDLYGEYYELALPRVFFRLPFNKEFIKSLALISRPSSGGIEVTAAVYMALRNARTWEELIENLQIQQQTRKFSRGAEAALSRILPLYEEGVLVNDKISLIPRAIIDFSFLPEETKYLAVQMYLHYLFLTSKYNPLPTLVVVEETKQQFNAMQVTPVIVPLFDLARKLRIKLILLMQTLPQQQQYVETLLQHHLIVLDLGETAIQYFKKYDFDKNILKIKKPNILIYFADKKEWKTVKFKPKLKPTEPRPEILLPVPSISSSTSRSDEKKYEEELLIERRNNEEFKKELNNIKRELQKIKEVVGNIQATSPNVVNRQLRALVREIDDLKRRKAADEKSIERIFDYIEDFDKRISILEKRLENMENILRKITEYLAYREQLRSMRGEEL